LIQDKPTSLRTQTRRAFAASPLPLVLKRPSIAQMRVADYRTPSSAEAPFVIG
jgi:hypothetical protein